MRWILVPLTALALVGCNAAEREVEDTRVAARQLIASVAAQEYVGVSINPIVDCTLDNASDDELGVLVESALAEGVTGRVNQRIVALMRRAPAQACIRAAGVVLPR